MNCKKFTRNQAGNILKHCNRLDPTRTYSNQDIDHTKTYLNYNLAPDHAGLTDFQYMKKRCEDLKIFKRSDVNWLCSWCVTLPKDYEGDEDEFFKKAYEFLEKKYGKENVVSAYVHKDENTPHMHFCFVPVIYDDEKKKYKVNAKKCIDRKELSSFHQKMQIYLEEQLHTEVNLLNGATKGGNKTITELKGIRKENELLINKNENLKEENRRLEEQKKKLETSSEGMIDFKLANSLFMFITEILINFLPSRWQKKINKIIDRNIQKDGYIDRISFSSDIDKIIDKENERESEILELGEEKARILEREIEEEL